MADVDDPLCDVCGESRLPALHVCSSCADAAESRDCGQDGVCAVSPGCQRHWQERNAELVRERDEARERLRAVEAERDALLVVAETGSASNLENLQLHEDLARLRAIESAARALLAAEDEFNRVSTDWRAEEDINVVSRALDETEDALRAALAARSEGGGA